MRSVEEILKKIEEKRSQFSFWPDVLTDHLPFENAKAFLNDGVTKETWEKCQIPLTEEAVKTAMQDYMEFAWGKVEDHRGLSASRSVDKMAAWLWLLESDLDLDSLPYAQYGAPQLKAVCDLFDFPVPQSESIQRMIQGLPCEEGCNQGCGL